MPSLFAKSKLFDLIDKVEKGERLDHDAAVRLMNSQDILALGTMANIVRERKNGHQTFYCINPTFKDTNVHHATMIYGNLVSREEQLDHLFRLRALQDKTGEFVSFSPRSSDTTDQPLDGTTDIGTTTGIEDLKAMAISRILLDNFDHIKASWNLLGLKLTQVSLAFGVDDLTGREVTRKAVIQVIQKAGRVAVERDGLGGSQ
ncbi:MAG TPA: FO synthase [Desulfosporosinus sp.]|nr:FO synthase [Desulfosporosinus sp.]